MGIFSSYDASVHASSLNGSILLIYITLVLHFMLLLSTFSVRCPTIRWASSSIRRLGPISPSPSPTTPKRKARFSLAEDLAILRSIFTHGELQPTTLAAELHRNPLAIQNRWANRLRADLEKTHSSDTRWTLDQESYIYDLVKDKVASLEKELAERGSFARAKLGRSPLSSSKLLDLVASLGTDWELIAEDVPGWNKHDLEAYYLNHVRPSTLSPETPFSPEEDQALTDYMVALKAKQTGKSPRLNWSFLARHIVPTRGPSQLRKRWHQVLSPSVDRGRLTSEELNILRDGISRFGTDFKTISRSLLPRRPPASLRNTWKESVQKNLPGFTLHEWTTNDDQLLINEATKRRFWDWDALRPFFPKAQDGLELSARVLYLARSVPKFSRSAPAFSIDRDIVDTYIGISRAEKHEDEKEKPALRLPINKYWLSQTQEKLDFPVQIILFRLIQCARQRRPTEAWAPDEDAQLLAAVSKHEVCPGIIEWDLVAKETGQHPKDCFARWRILSGQQKKGS